MTKGLTKARFDARLTLEQKQLFERAAQLSGFKNLSEFVIVTLNQRAKEVIEKEERLFGSERDKGIFFEALLNPPTPNEKLVAAYEKYKAISAK